MKRIIFFLVTIIATTTSNAQFDSAAIVQQHTSLRNNISSYTNQPFSVLYNALTIKPSIVTGFNPHYKMSVEDASQFHYADPNNPAYREVYIDIEWETPIPDSETLMYQNKVRRNFNAQEYTIYANRIMKRIRFFPDPMIDENGVYLKKKPEIKKVAAKKKAKVK